MPDPLRLLTWNDYVAPTCSAAFAAESGYAVVEEHVDSNDEFVRRLAAGEVYDVVTPTDWAAAALRTAGLLQPLDMERLPNWTNVTQPYFQHPAYDQADDGRKYTSVYMFGTEGIAVRLDRVESSRRTWRMLYDERFAGQISMIDGSREVLAPALFLLGSDPNCTDPGLLEEATRMVVEQRALVCAYDSRTITQRIIDGVAVVQCWDGDVAAAITAGAPQVHYMLPREGFRVWADAVCIPATAPQPAVAHAFIDYVLRPEVAAHNADFAGYQPVVPAAEPLIRSLVQRSMRPTDEQMEQGVFLRDLGAFNAVYEEAYRSVRAA